MCTFLLQLSCFKCIQLGLYYFQLSTFGSFYILIPQFTISPTLGFLNFGSSQFIDLILYY